MKRLTRKLIVAALAIVALIASNACSAKLGRVTFTLDYDLTPTKTTE